MDAAPQIQYGMVIIGVYAPNRITPQMWHIWVHVPYFVEDFFDESFIKVSGKSLDLSRLQYQKVFMEAITWMITILDAFLVINS